MQRQLFITVAGVVVVVVGWISIRVVVVVVVAAAVVAQWRTLLLLFDPGRVGGCHAPRKQGCFLATHSNVVGMIVRR